jgi:hypothetical protein
MRRARQAVVLTVIVITLAAVDKISAHFCCGADELVRLASARVVRKCERWVDACFACA